MSQQLNALCSLQNPGRLRLQKDKVVFKLSKTGKVEQIGAGDVRACHWMEVAKGYELKVMVSSGGVYKFAGFRETVSRLKLLSVT